MDTPETVEVETPKHELGHSVGKFMVGGIAAYLADQAAVKLYDRVLTAVRTRKVR